MDTQLIQTLKGFRDFLPEEKKARQFVATKITEIFERFGFEPLETPTLEYASLLLGKYGAEADKLVYTFKDAGERKIGLRYDQTVPTARVLAQYQSELPKYFRRYQIQNVYRAEKPQKGRYREFTQCDIDIFGSTSPLADAEILACTYQAFKNVGYQNIIIKINDRKTLLDTLSRFATEQVGVFSIIQSIDKLDKVTSEKVLEELVAKGLAQEIAKQALEAISQAQPTESLQSIISMAENLGIPKEAIKFSSVLARGLDYYTGMIFEIVLPDYQLGSFAGGGRYDNLIEQLGGRSIPAVGVAFGFDRMVEAAKELNLLLKNQSMAQVLVTVFNEELSFASAQIATQLRTAGINVELFPNSSDDVGKQFKYASRIQVPYVVVIGPEEKENKVIQLKNMQTGEQQKLSIEQVIQLLRL